MKYYNHHEEQINDENSSSSKDGSKKNITILFKGESAGSLLVLFLSFIGVGLSLFFGDEECKKGSVVTSIIVFIVYAIIITYLLNYDALVYLI